MRPDWIDYNGHMTDWRYLQVFGDATDALLRHAGVDDDYRRAGRALYTVESQVRHRAQARINERLYVASQVLLIEIAYDSREARGWPWIPVKSD